jgi:nucleoid DNA-binding protein
MKEHNASNPRTGEVFVVKAKKVVKFKITLNRKF